VSKPAKKKTKGKAAQSPVLKGEVEPGLLTGWPAIARYLGQPVAVAQRWGKSGMPVRRKGRFMAATQDQLREWLGREAGTAAPVHISQSADQDLVADLRRGLKQARGAKRGSRLA